MIPRRSLQLVRAQGILAAAEDLAAWLAECVDPRATLIVSPHATLDAALQCAGDHEALAGLVLELELG